MGRVDVKMSLATDVCDNFGRSLLSALRWCLCGTWAGVARFSMYVTGARCLCLGVAATQVQ